MRIKRYMDFLIESGQYKFGCVMVEVPVSNWDNLLSSIEKEDIYEVDGDRSYGLQENPHVTILYGLHSGVSAGQVKEIFDSFEGDIRIEIDGIGIFENKDFDVVKMNVVPTEGLQRLHDMLSELPNSNEYPEYKPHMTLAYVKKGCGKKYEDPSYSHEVDGIERVCYSMPSGEKEYFSVG